MKFLLKQFCLRRIVYITKFVVSINLIHYETRLFKYIENFSSKNLKFSDKKKTVIFFIFLLKT